MLETSSSTMLTLSENVIIQALPEMDQYYAFNLESGNHFSLNNTAYWILEAIGKGITIAELKERFMEYFDLSPEMADKDISEVLQFAMENSIIKEADDEEKKS